MFELTITKIKYPKNESTTFIYETLENLLKDLEKMIQQNKINKNDILRLEKN